jgi:hypothetical protein
LGGPLTIIKNTPENVRIYRKKLEEFILSLNNEDIDAFEEHQLSAIFLEYRNVKLIYDSTNCETDNGGKNTYDAYWSGGKVFIRGEEKLLYHFYRKDHTKFQIIGNSICAFYDKKYIDDFLWIVHFSEKYETLLPYLMNSIKKYSNRKFYFIFTPVIIIKLMRSFFLLFNLRLKFLDQLTNIFENSKIPAFIVPNMNLFKSTSELLFFVKKSKRRGLIIEARCFFAFISGKDHFKLSAIKLYVRAIETRVDSGVDKLFPSFLICCPALLGIFDYSLYPGNLYFLSFKTRLNLACMIMEASTFGAKLFFKDPKNIYLNLLSLSLLLIKASFLKLLSFILFPFFLICYRDHKFNII